MKIRSALFAATLLFASSAFAFHCPAEMKKIDDALAKNPTLTAAQMDEVKKYRADGEKLHKEGKHQESLDTLAKAEKILGVQQPATAAISVERRCVLRAGVLFFRRRTCGR